MAFASMESEVVVRHLALIRHRAMPQKEEAIAMFLGVLQLASRVVIFAGLEKPSERRSKVADAATKYS
jgi:hypothetical protein